MSLKKIFFIFFISTSFCFAVYNNHLIEDIYIQNDKTIKKLSAYKGKELQNYKAKIILNKNLKKDKTLYLQIFCDVNNLKESNVTYIKDKHSIFVKINTNKLKNLVFSFSFKNKKEINFSIVNMNKFEFEVLHKYKQLILGISFGIVFSAFLYNLVLYFNTFYKAFLYYAGVQFFLFSAIFNLQSFIQKTYKFTTDALIVELSATFAILFLLLFSKEVLELNKKRPLLNKLFNILILINILDALFTLVDNNSFLYDKINLSDMIGIILITSIYCSFKAKKDSVLFALGWFAILFTLIIVEFKLTYFSDNLVYSIGLPLEALILSFALGYKLKNIIKEKENLLIQQSKLASMGEMLNNIAHQWKQPLANLSFINMDLKLSIKKDEIDKKYLEQIVIDSNKQIKFMAKTLDNFKGFYQPNKEKEKFLHSSVVKKTIEIIKPSLQNTPIKLQLEIISDSHIYSYENEYIQVILNILNNAKEALLEKQIQNPYIKISVNKNKKNILIIEDNAGGINKQIIDKIFNPYFSTKHNNSGIGLYMSKVILDSHLKGQIEVISKNNISQFKINI